MTAIDKYTWFKAIYAEPAFTAGEKAVRAHIAIVNVFGGKDTFCVRQDTIANQCGISKPTVNSAIRRAKDLGYLTVSREHARGYHRNGADEIRLLLPELSKDALPNSEGNGVESGKDSLPNSEQSGVKQTAELGKANGQSGVKQTAEWGKAPNSPTSGNTAPNSSGEQFSKKTSSGRERGVRNVSNARGRETPPTREGQGLHPLPENQWIEPFKYCPTHPNDTTISCIPCKIQREEWKTWHDTYDEREAQYYRDHPEERPDEVTQSSRSPTVGLREVSALPAVIPTPENGQYFYTPDVDADLVTALHRNEANRRDQTDPGPIGELFAKLFDGPLKQQTTPTRSLDIIDVDIDLEPELDPRERLGRCTGTGVLAFKVVVPETPDEAKAREDRQAAEVARQTAALEARYGPLGQTA